jgi:HD-GYP domain-containing protein (c-di-GMP phosphodiesterase class II)/ABC-type amino acid transport substrate-binding protein
MIIKTGSVHTSIRMTVVTVFVIATLITAAVAIGLQYYFSHSMARSAAADLYTTTAQSIASELEGIGEVNTNVITLLAKNPALKSRDREATQLKIFASVLEMNPMFYGIYVGSKDGSFFELVDLNTSEYARSKLLAVPADRWLVLKIERTPTGTVRQYQYLDEHFQPRASRSEPTEFQVADRPWFKSAFESGNIEVSDPYMFSQLDAPGRTVSKRVAGSDTVVGLDITLSTISEFLASHEVAADGELYLYNREGMVVASSSDHDGTHPKLAAPQLALSAEDQAFLASLPALKVSNEINWPPFDYTLEGQPRGYSIDVMNLLAEMLGLEFDYVNGFSWPELVEQFREGRIDLLHSVTLTANNRKWGLPGEAFASLPYALLTRADQPQLSSVGELGQRPLVIPVGWSITEVIRNTHPGLTLLEADSTLHAMEMVQAGEAYAALDNEVIMRYIARHYFIRGINFHPRIDLGTDKIPDKLHVFVSKEQQQLRQLLDRAIKAIGAQQRQQLESRWLRFDRQLDETTSETVPAKLLVEIANTPANHGQLMGTSINGQEHVVYAAPTSPAGKRMFVGIVTPESALLAPFLSKVMLSIIVTGAVLLLLLPLSWFFSNPIVRPVRQLAHENDKVRRREFDLVERVPSRVKELDELSDSMVSMVASIQAYEQSQRDLMDSFIKLIAEAIDEKSPYTGGHCERVPELALMLAEKASSSNAPAFCDFHLETDDQWREYRIAAWLHDCGKITTPEHIVDKGSKLEVIYNRIHEVRMRFEVLWRDAEIHYFEQLAEHPDKQEDLRAQLNATRHELQDDFDFVAGCNVGGEFLDEEKQARLRLIAAKTWQRNFSDRAGLSPVEELRVRGEEASLPVTEPLLADKPEHIIERTRSTDYDPKLGINMDIPENLYNQGEVYNLSISRGTLTNEDRFKINEHMISTIRMLERLPFPDELKNVPRYASTHHETMRGSGYPRKLPGSELSIPERILAVADVFEALTASDRPYKKAKPVSVAVDILHKMVEDDHIDRECFELFLKEGVYLQYAQEYLCEGQVDEVDIGKYIA